MSNEVLIIGHRKPDNDSIASAVAYSYLKNEIARIEGSDLTYLPARLGPLPAESEWVLEKNGLDAPMLISHVFPRVCDVMTSNPITVSPKTTMLEAGQILKKYNIRSLVVEDHDRYFFGLISTRHIAERYVTATDGAKNEQEAALSLRDSLSQPVSDLMERDVLKFDRYGLLKDARCDLMESELREGIVLDDDELVEGIVTRSDIARYEKRKVILVDHNESAQAAPGIESANILEIVDHHRIGDITTSKPIKFIGDPIGSTATIVSLEFERAGIEIPPSIAEVILSAIMTDTILLKSPTTTEVDRVQAKKLGELIGKDAIEFGMEVLSSRGNDEDLEIEKLVGADAKEFWLDDSKILICAHETVNIDAILKREQEIRSYMDSLLDSNGYEFVLFMITDIVRVGSQFICEGNRSAMNKVFNIECTGNGGTWMPGIISRKKQVAARLLNN